MVQGCRTVRKNYKKNDKSQDKTGKNGGFLKKSGIVRKFN